MRPLSLFLRSTLRAVGLAAFASALPMTAQAQTPATPDPDEAELFQSFDKVDV
jgi:hypothetical protein